jgi:curved DNA-binding protein CbpA
MDRIDCYMILGISSSASVEDIKSAYRQKAVQFHPDRNPDKAATEMFKRLTEAYNVLMGATFTEEKRAPEPPTYDEWLRAQTEKFRNMGYGPKKKAKEPTGTLTSDATMGAIHRNLYRSRLQVLRSTLREFDSEATVMWDEDYRPLLSYFHVEIYAKESILRAVKTEMDKWTY